MLRVELTEQELEPLIRRIVGEALSGAAKLPAGRLAYTEAEAAALLGVPKHVLRDSRLRGEIQARRVGKGYLYSHAELTRFLTSGSRQK